jgi:hypothetical protein
MSENFDKYMQFLMDSAYIDEDDMVIGRDISSFPEVKIIFDGYGDLEEETEDGEYIYVEGGNKDMQSFAIFIHKDALEPDFEFPEHETTPWALIHRTEEEVCLYAWYDVVENYWEFLNLEERVEDTSMTSEQVMEILEGIYNYYHREFPEPVFRMDENGRPLWPFPTRGTT